MSLAVFESILNSESNIKVLNTSLYVSVKKKKKKTMLINNTLEKL